MQNVTENEFLLSVLVTDPTPEEVTCALQGHKTIRLFLIALNVATVGMFYWVEEPWVHPIVHVSDSLDGARHAGELIMRPESIEMPLAELSEHDVQNAAILFGVLAMQQDPILESEYSRGLLLLRMNFLDINFRREAFMCFYRALENFVARRILKVRKLTNELRDLQRTIAALGASGGMVNELKAVYKVRSSQVAHSQIMPREVTLEEVIETKTFLDFVMHKTFKAQGVKMLQAHRDNSEIGTD